MPATCLDDGNATVASDSNGRSAVALTLGGCVEVNTGGQVAVKLDPDTSNALVCRTGPTNFGLYVPRPISIELSRSQPADSITFAEGDNNREFTLAPASSLTIDASAEPVDLQYWVTVDLREITSTVGAGADTFIELEVAETVGAEPTELDYAVGDRTEITWPAITGVIDQPSLTGVGGQLMVELSGTAAAGTTVYIGARARLRLTGSNAAAGSVTAEELRWRGLASSGVTL